MRGRKFIFITLLLTCLPITVSLAEIATTTAAPNVAATTTATPTPTALTSLPSLIPSPPKLNVRSYILLDAASGNVIAAQDPDKRVEPASLTKLMTLYIIADALKTQRITLQDQVPISKKAWQTGGSRMFAKVGGSIPAQQLIDGIVIASGNDATVAMAEYIGGTEDTFVDLMNKTAATLGMNNTNFVDSNGLPNPNHYSTVRDLSALARAWIVNFPEYYPWFGQKWIKYNGIKQPNRNRLLWRDPSVDGMKTGHTEHAGFCLAASGIRNGMRLIAIVMGAKTDEGRADDTEALLNYGFRFFEDHKLYAANTALLNPPIKFGKEKTTPLGISKDLAVTIPIGTAKQLKTTAVLNKNLQAPLAKGQTCGTLTITLNNKIIASEPLVALADNPETSFFGKLLDKIF